MVAQTAGSVQQEKISLRRVWWVGLLAAVVATVVNLLIFGLSVAISAVPVVPVLPPDPVPLTITPVILATVIPVLGATLIFAIISRLSRRPIRLFRIVAVVILLLSFLTPIQLLFTSGDPRITVLSTVMVFLLHIAPAVICVGMLTTMARER